jgi:hypothetical protein
MISVRVDCQIHYVDLNEVVSKVRSSSNETKQSLTLKDFVHKINLISIVPNIGSYHVRSKFEKRYWHAFCEVKNSNGHESYVIVCKSRAKLNDGLPAAQLVLTENSDLYNMDTEGFVHLLKDKLHYLGLQDYQASEYVRHFSHSICLAIFRLDDKANKFIKVCSEKFVLPREVVQLNPRRPILYREYCRSHFDGLIPIKSRVFSVFRPESYKNLLWIHCFMKNKILPIGGANTNVPGLYSLNQMTKLNYEYYDRYIIGIFGIDKFHFRRGNDRVYSTWKYVLV